MDIFGKFRSKASKPTEGSASTKTPKARGIEVVEDDPDTVWGLWDSALADLDSRHDEPTLERPQATVPRRVSSKVPVKVAAPVWDEQDTQPMEFSEKTPEQRKNDALAVVEMHHQRIAGTIRSLWGYKECALFIDKLIMNGGDGMGNARIGFNPDAADAMMVLSDLHDAEFGPPDKGGGTGFGDFSVRTGFDGLR